MKHIVIIPYEIASKLNPTFMLAKGLLKAGYQVTIVGSVSLGRAAHAQGLPFKVGAEGSPVVRPKADGGHPLKYLFSPSKMIDVAVDAMGMAPVPAMLAQLAPDLILADVEQHEYIISAVPTGIPVVLLSTFVSLFKCPGLPPAHVRIIPGVGFKGSMVGMEMSWLRFRLNKLQQRLKTRMREKGLDKLSLLRALSRRTGFNFQKETDLYQWMIPFVYRRLPVLALISREFDFPHTPPHHYHHAGALIDLSRQEVQKMGDPDQEMKLNQLMETQQNRPDHQKVIYCGFGAFFKGDDTRFWQKLINAFGGHPQWTIVFGLGGRLEPSALGRLPENIHAFRWVPQLQMLQISDCAVIHGGITSINECILSGVPMLVFPFDTTDQHGAAARVAYHRVGIRGNRSEDSAAVIRGHVQRILDEKSFASAVAKMRSFYLRDINQGAAVKTLECIIDNTVKKVKVHPKDGLIAQRR